MAEVPNWLSNALCGLAGRGLAEIRRATLGMQLRLTPDGKALAQQRERESDVAWQRGAVATLAEG